MSSKQRMNMKSNKPKSSQKKYTSPKPSQQVPRAMPMYRGPPMVGGSEIKACDYYIAASPFTTGSGRSLLNGVQTGTGFFNRIGNKTEGKNLKIRGVIRNTLTSTQNILRMAIVYDRACNGVTPNLVDIYSNVDQAGTALTTQLEINLNNRDRFTVLREKQWYGPACTNTAGVLTNGPSFPGGGEDLVVNEFIDLKGLPTHYSGTTAAIGSVVSGAIFMVLWNEEGTTNAWAFTGNARYRFNDK